MIDDRQCMLCKHVRIKTRFFGGKKFTCSVHNREVSEKAVCPKFTGDGDKILKHAGFRPHEFGSPNGCDKCAYRGSSHKERKTRYTCQKNNVQFWPDFDPMKYICDHFKDGGMDALIGLLADLTIEENRYKKGGK